MDNGRVMIEWEYDVNQLKVSDPMNNLMSEMFVGSKEKNGFVQVQHQTPYIFATDDPDLVDANATNKY